MERRWFAARMAVVLGFGAAGCADGLSRSREPSEVAHPDGWTDASHGKAAAPDYARLFEADEVPRLEITIAATDFAAMRADLTLKYGTFGGGGGSPQPPGPPPPEAIAACVGLAEGQPCSYLVGGSPTAGVCRGPPPGSQGPVLCAVAPAPDDGFAADPIFVPVTVTYGGLTWWHVGMRFKGNSSLRTAWQEGIGKLAFRLDFDQFEDAYPEIEDQRFWGFKKMTFSNGFRDPSLLREKTAAELFRAAGVPVARAAFCRVFVDSGGGPAYWGLYTMVEDPADTLLATQFADAGGNLYKPEGEGATWRRFVAASFVKKTNEELADFADVERAIAALGDQSGGAEAWRAGLDAAFDTGGFVRYLAVNALAQNWDAYGRAPHNYYLYGDPAAGGRLTWIPWDLNESFKTAAIAHPPVALALDDVGDDWPLIRLLADDPVYLAAYRDALAAALVGPFAVAPLTAALAAEHARVAPFAVGPDGEQPGYTFLTSPAAFTGSLDASPDGLAVRVSARHQEALDYLDGP